MSGPLFDSKTDTGRLASLALTKFPVVLSAEFFFSLCMHWLVFQADAGPEGLCRFYRAKLHVASMVAPSVGNCRYGNAGR